MSARVRCVLLLVIGAALLVPFDSTVALFGGVAFLLAGIVYGVFTIASPEFLSAVDDDVDPSDR